MSKYPIKSIDDLNDFASKLAKSISRGDVFALVGELGSGKTALVQAVAEELGVKDEVRSPTFSILKVYEIPKGKIKKMCHIDLYRVESFEAAIGVEEYIDDPDTACFIEWADKAASHIPQSSIWIYFGINSDGSRTITKTSPK